MQWTYLALLIFSLSGLGYADYKHKLFLFSPDVRKYILVFTISLVFFLVVDLFGTGYDIFYSNAQYIIGVEIFPGIPIEELFFLLLATYSALFIKRIISL